MAKKQEFYLGNEGLPTTDVQFSWTPEMVEDLDKCRKSILQFSRHFTIVNLDKGKIKIELRDYQKRILKALAKNRMVAVLASRQCGKALALTTPIKAIFGWTTMGEIKTGDKIYDENGNICTVTKAHDILYGRNCYKVIFDNGEEIIADEDHLWFTQTRNDRSQKYISDGSVKTTKDILHTLYTGSKKEPFHRIPIAKPILGQNINTPIDPYLYGVWLGDGRSDGVNISVGKQDLDNMLKNLSHLSQKFNIVVHRRAHAYDINIIGKDRKRDTICFKTQLRENNLLYNKHIISQYLNADRHTRLELLRGLMDTDGYIGKKRGDCHFYTTIPALASGVYELLISLGYKVYKRNYIPTLNGKACAPCTEYTFFPNDVVFKLDRKVDRQQIIFGRSQYHYIKSITPVVSQPVRCITVDSPNSLYLCGKQLIPTHNSTLMTIYALWTVCFKKDQRILIIANKEKTAIQIFSRVRMAYEKLPNYLKPGVATYGKTEITLGNGSSIGISTTSSSAARGDSVNCLTGDSKITIQGADGLAYDVDFNRLERIMAI